MPRPLDWLPFGQLPLSRGVSSAEEQADEALGERAVWRAKKFEGAEARLQQDPFLLGESCEAGAAVIMAHAARSNPAKRQIVLHDVEDDVVDGDAARRGSAQNAIYAP